MSQDDEDQEDTRTYKDDEDQEDTRTYKVIVNHKEQYSIWPAERNNPIGWLNVGKSGSKAKCLAYIKELWADVSKKMDEMAKKPTAAASSSQYQEAARKEFN